jgi:predicted regulator of Ras-like GTPase activity (Roadblock/LC7/MglB family)
MSDEEQIASVLTSIRTEVGKIVGSFIARPDGLIFAYDVLQDKAEKMDSLSAMSASLYSIAKRFTQTLEMNFLEELVLKCETGYAVLMSINGKGILCCITEKDIIIGRLLVQMRVSVPILSRIIND